MNNTAASAELECLNAFVGTWDTEGVLRADPSGDPVKFDATDAYEWLSGGHFLLHRFDANMPAGNVKGIEVIGYDRAARSYSMYSFDSLGNAAVMRARLQNGTWTFVGDTTRFTGSFSDEGRVFSGLWELRPDIATPWQPWMDVRLKKVD